MATRNLINKLVLETRQHDEALRESRERTKELEKEVKTLSKSLKEAQDASKGQAESSKEGTAASGLFASATGSLGDAVMQGAGKFLQFASVGAVVAGALQVAKDAFMSSETNIDEWGRTMEGAKGVYHAFVVSLADGNWDGLLSKMEEANRAARDLYDAFDQLGSMQTNNAPLIATLEGKLADLRLRKQDGEDVDTEIKATAESLSALRRGLAEQGKTANLKGIANELKVRGLNDTSANATARQLLREGQPAYDRAARQFAELQEKGSRYEERYHVSVSGSSYTTREKVFYEHLLTEAERRKYKVAKAVTEGEASIAPYAQGYASSIQAETSAKRQEYKFNSQAGAGKGNGGKAERTFESKISAETLKVPTHFGLGNVASLEALEKRLAGYKKQLRSATNSADYTAANEGISRTTREIEAQPVALRLGLNVEDVLRTEDQIRSLRDGLELKPIKIDVDTSKLAKGGRDIATAYNGAFSAVSSIGGALANVDDKGLNVAGTIMQAVANVALGFASSLKGTATPWDFIAGAAAGLATMTATIIAIKKQTAGSFAEGGIVGGNSYTGDRLWAHVNSREMILNTRQQANILSKIEGSQGGGAGGGTSSISGEQIVTVINAYGRRTGRGEILR